MAKNLSDTELKEFLGIGRNSARRVSRDPDVFEAAANFAVARLVELLANVSEARSAREQWVRITARNEARHLGAKLRPELVAEPGGGIRANGKDKRIDQFIEGAIRETHHGGPSLGSLVANKVAFDEAWALLAPGTRLLLEARYFDGRSVAEIAKGRGLAEGTVYRKVKEAKKAAQPLLEDLYADILG